MSWDKCQAAWQVLQQKVVFKGRPFSIILEKCRLSDGEVVEDYLVLDGPDWVNVIALDSHMRLVLIRQYRQGSKGCFLELPGGSVHPNEEDDWLKAAQRELLEETGHRSDQWKYLGAFSPNPAIQRNKLHTFLAENCMQSGLQQLDPEEELTVELVDRQQMVSLIAHGKIEHCLMLASLFCAAPHLERSFGRFW